MHTLKLVSCYTIVQWYILLYLNMFPCLQHICGVTSNSTLCYIATVIDTHEYMFLSDIIV